MHLTTRKKIFINDMQKTMKNILKMLILFPLLMSCVNYKWEDAVAEEEYLGDYGFNKELTVPVGTSVVYVTYGEKTLEIPVTPEVVVPSDGKDVEPWGKVTLSLVSPVKTVFDAYYLINGKRVELIENGVVNEKILTKAQGENTLVEPKPYDDSDLGFTTYHSSGCVFFEDSFPTSSRQKSGVYDTDFNDFVLDYDFETVVVPDELLDSEGWREQVKVVLHIRAVGGTAAARTGVILEGFDMKNVREIETHCSFDSWQNPHGVLPKWTERKLQENSLHYETGELRPCVEVGAIFRLNDTNSGAGTEEYTRVNDNGTTFTTVFNPRLNGYWTSPKTEQYSPDLASLFESPQSLASVQKLTYYNVIPGYVNVSGGLFTYTVIYHMKARNEMDEQKKAEVLDNMMKTVYETTRQNFYIINKDWTPIGLKGYMPGDFKVKGCNSYAEKYNKIVAEHSDALDPTVPYKSNEGLIWAFKCPTLTRHLWNKLRFSGAYPKYMGWIDSNGEENADWYEDEVDTRYLTCWW